MENERFELMIEDVSTQGEGIGRREGLVVFVPGALPGDRVLAEIREDKGRFAKAALIEMLEASPDRVKPRCPHAAECGGCPLMGLSYEAQLRLKERRVRDALTRIAGLEEPVLRPIIGMAEPWRFRNKAEFAVRGNTCGYMKRGSHDIIPVGDCLIQSEAAMARLAQLRDELKPTQKYFTRATIRTSASGEVMTILEGKDGSVQADRRVLRDEIVTDMGTLKTEVSPLSFYQVNPQQCGRLYSKVQEYAALTGSERILDLYCGAGSIGLSMASKISKLIGVESVKDAVIDANRNAVINGIVNDQFICGRAEDVLPTKLQGVKADVVILDPPRAGCAKSLLDCVLTTGADRLIYVSCDPSTLARDLKILTAGGYRFAEATPVDMFPHSLHVETVVLMSRTDAGKG